MKHQTPRKPPLLALFSLFAVTAQAEPQVMNDAPTYAQLLAARRRAELVDPMKHMAPSKVEDPAVNRPKDILTESDVLCFQGIATLVPKRAILRVPGNYQGRVGLQPGVRIVGWREFYALNRGWITTVDVSWKQASGGETISQDTRQVMDRSGNLVVATYMGGPISVVPPGTTETTTASNR